MADDDAVPAGDAARAAHLAALLDALPVDRRARVRAMVVLACDDGMSERAVTKAANVDRMNIRKWLGKKVYRRDARR